MKTIQFPRPVWGALAGVAMIGIAGFASADVEHPKFTVQAIADADAAAPADRKVKYYRDPMGSPDTSPVPKKDSMGMDYIPVYEGEDGDDVAAKKPPGTLQRAGASASAAASPDRKIKYYRNPMGLADTSPVPKQDSMGMDYIPVYEGEDSDDDSVKLSPGKIQRTGVKSEPAAPRTLPHHDPRAGQHPAGRAPHLGDLDAGGKLRPEGRWCHHRIARRQGSATDGSLQPGDIVGGGRIHLDHQLQSHCRRRSLWPGLAAAADESRRAGCGHRDDGENPHGSDRHRVDLAPRRHRARTQRDRGDRAQPGDVLFRIADHTLVWAVIDIAERDLGALAVGQPATVKARGFPGREFIGKIDVVYPEINKETRTGRLRIELGKSGSSC